MLGITVAMFANVGMDTFLEMKKDWKSFRRWLMYMRRRRRLQTLERIEVRIEKNQYAQGITLLRAFSNTTVMETKSKGDDSIRVVLCPRTNLYGRTNVVKY
ncbi:hypothetical protein BT69DRAFT_1284819 [Atractiella rhizophila]|nr:hypothetical protein BT69DRAFT_1284819 [Atractiella rhizophila]